MARVCVRVYVYMCWVRTGQTLELVWKDDL